MKKKFDPKYIADCRKHTEENMWTDFDVPPSFLERLLQCIIDQNLYPHNS